MISSGNIEDGSNVSLSAGSYIEVEPGFEIEVGASFVADFNPCVFCDIPNSDDCDLVDLYNPEADTVTASLVGFVYDQNGAPVENVTVTPGNVTTTSTDLFGHFFFKDETMNSHGEMVTLSPVCYHVTILKRFYPIAGKESRIHTQLTPQNYNQSFDSSMGGTADILGSSGTDGLAQVKITFPENAIVNGSGIAYNGM